MEDYLNWSNNNNNNNDSHENNEINSSAIPNIPSSTINDQDLLDFSGLDQFMPTDSHSGGSSGNFYQPTAEIKQEQQDQLEQQQLDEFQPRSYHLTPSSYNNKQTPMSSSFSGVRRSLSKAMTNSRKNSIIKDELSSSVVKSPRSRKSSIVGTPSSISGSFSGNGQTTSVERKRRDNINDKIQELLTIIPDTFFYENDKSTGTKDGKPNKGQILTKSVEYIQFLQNEIDFKNRKEVEYVYKLKKLNFDTSNFQNTSAEIGLGKIGVGPLNHLQHEELKKKWLSQNPNFKDFKFNETNNNNNYNNDDDTNNDNDNQDYLNF